MIKENQGDQGALFSIFNRMCCKQLESPLPDHQSQEELANDFCQFFHDKISNINRNFTANEPTDLEQFLDISRERSEHNFEFRPVTEEMVKKYITKASCKTSQLDAIPTQLTQDCADIIAPVITTIFNKSMQEECVPKDFKRAIITPLIKKKSAGTTFSNYRPVSNLPFLSKILERIVLDQLIEHCTQ